MTIVTRVKDGVTVLELSGRFTAGERMGLYDAVQGLLNRGVTQIVFHMGGIDIMDSSGLGELSRAEGAVRAKGAALALAQVPDGVQRTLSIARLTSAFRIYGSEADALRSFRG